MLTSSVTALMATFLFSVSTSALPRIVKDTTVWETKTVYVNYDPNTESFAIQAQKTDPVTLSTVPVPVSVASTSTSSLPAGILYPSFASGSGVPTGSGLFFTASGSGSYRPTGKPRGNDTYSRTTRTHTRSIAPSSSSTNQPISPSNVPTTATFLSTRIATSIIPLPTSIRTTSLEPIPKPSSTIPISSVAPTSSKPSSTVAPIPSSTGVPFLRGVNLGGWLVLEKWMNDDAFTGAFSSAVDQFTFDSISGSASALDKHWSTFFTESDIKQIAATGINALRIPIGFWAYDNTNTPYIKGADAYLEKAIVWARNAGMKVWVDCHGSPGSQNGFDNSGKKGDVNWQQTANLARSISVLKTMAQKYGAQEYADVVVGLELVNEPISYGNNQFSTTQSWAQEAYAAVRAAATNKNMVIVMHDAFQGAEKWTGVAKTLNAQKSFGVDSHLYQLFSDDDNALTQAQHITKACGWASELAAANQVMPTYVGEWSAATNICVNPDGSTTAGTSSSVSGSQCQSVAFDKWNKAMIEQVRRFVEAQLDVFESSSSGYFIWSAKGPGGWGFLNGIGNGAIPNPVTQRKYPGQCGGNKRRETRGRLGMVAEAW